MKIKLLNVGIRLFDKLPETKFVGEDWALREWSWGIADTLWDIRRKEIISVVTKAVEKEMV